MDSATTFCIVCNSKPIHFKTNAVFIGEESGVGYYGNCPGPNPDLILPNSKVIPELPLIKYSITVMDYLPKEKGIIPAPSSIIDILNNSDEELNFTKSIIK